MEMVPFWNLKADDYTVASESGVWGGGSAGP